MTPDEFEFWQKAYLAALTGTSSDIYQKAEAIDAWAKDSASLAVESYRTAKSTVVNTVQGVGPAGD